jgi:hypothetical protein
VVLRCGSALFFCVLACTVFCVGALQIACTRNFTGLPRFAPITSTPKLYKIYIKREQLPDKQLTAEQFAVVIGSCFCCKQFLVFNTSSKLIFECPRV